VYELPLHRLAGLYAPANGVFSTPAFALPAGGGGLWLNADARWGAPLATGGCDEGCAGYVFCELVDAATGAAVPGFGRGAFDVLMNTSGTQIPLAWRAPAAARAAAAGQAVRLRVHFRDAIIYAFGVDATGGSDSGGGFHPPG
jgi:hypothetical protein